jgi:uncharacterized membrane protein
MGNLKIGGKSKDSRIYTCTGCGNKIALIKTEKAPACLVCNETKKITWKPSKKELIIKTRNVEKEFLAQRTIIDKISDGITAFCGNMWFVYVHIAWFGWWIYDNIGPEAWDPYPYGMLTLVVSLEAILLATFILISQNREAQVAKKRAELDYQVDVKAEKRIEELISMQKKVYKELLKIRNNKKTVKKKTKKKVAKKKRKKR